MSGTKNIEQESENGDSSTQPNESYNLTIALNSYQISNELSNYLILGLSQQKRFKDVSYLKIKNDNSITLKAYDIIQNIFVVIQVRKQINSIIQINKYLQKIKQISSQNEEYFIKIIDYWIISKENQYSLIFIEMEYIQDNLETYLDNQYSQNNQNEIDQKLKQNIIIQLFNIAKIIQDNEINNNIIKINRYFMKENILKLSLLDNNLFNIQTDIKKNDYNNQTIKNNIFQCLIEQEIQNQNNANYILSIGILQLMIWNWQSFDNHIIEQFGVIKLLEEMLNENINSIIQIDNNNNSVFFNIYQEIIKDYKQQQNESNINQSKTIEYYIDMLENSQKQDVQKIKYNEENSINQKQQQNQPEINNHQKNEIQNKNNNNNQKNEINENTDKQINKNPKSNIIVLNPSMIINKYIDSIEKITQNQMNQNLESKRLTDKSNENQNNNLYDQIKNDSQTIQNIQQQENQSMLELNQDIQNIINNNDKDNEKQLHIKIENEEQNKEEKEIENENQQNNQNYFTPLNSKGYNSEIKNQLKQKSIIFSAQKDENNELNISYKNNDIVIEIKDNDDDHNHNSPSSVPSASAHKSDLKKNNNININNNNNNLNNSNVAIKQNPYDEYKRYLQILKIESENMQEIFIKQFMENNQSCLYNCSIIKPKSYIRVKIFTKYNPFFGKGIMETIFVPFIIIFNKSWFLKKDNNIIINIIMHLFFWMIKILNICCMLVLASVYLSILFTVLVIVHTIYFIILILTAILLIPTGFIRIFLRMCLKLEDLKSRLIYSRQNSYTWYELDYNYSIAKEFNILHHQMIYRKYQYEITPQKQFDQSYQLR